MKIRKIADGHITNCAYCKMQGAKVVAVWHLTGANKQACDVHKMLLEHIRDREPVANDFSEADYQTWMRL
jgi:hypothetical protein